jgi:hypothetical protein
MKRARNELTGGSGDVNPQSMSIRSKGQAVADDPTINSVGLPIPRLPIAKGRSIVMELLNVKFIINSFTVAAAATNGFYCNLTTNPNGITVANDGTVDPRTIADWRFSFITGAMNANSLFPMESFVDLTDKAGHGVLVATDSLSVNIATVNTGAQNFVIETRIYYRFKDVGLEEYIGIVQSQQ